MKYILIVFIIIHSSLMATDFAVISDLGSSARSIGIGNVEGFSSAADTIFENPAGLTRISDYNISAFNATLLNDIHYYSLNLASHTKYGYVGVGLYEVSVKSIPETFIDENTTVKKVSILNTFDYKDNIFKLGYAFNVNDTLALGVNGTLYDRKFYTITGSAIDLDFGALKKFDKTTLSFMIKNILPRKNFTYNDGSTETIPTSIYVSLKSTYRDFEFYPQLKYTNSQPLISMGMVYDPSYLPLLNFLFGYKQHLSYVYEKQQTGTIGVGLSLLDMNFYYSFEKSDYKLNDNNSYFSINYNF
jgi:hypothetical protein